MKRRIISAVSSAQGDRLQQPVRLEALDGYVLGATLFHTVPHSAPRHAAVLCGGGGIPARAYRRFATWLASRGVPVLTYDNRGIGASRPARLRGFDAGLEDWSDYDCAAAIAWLRSRYPECELVGIAHSIGGLVLTSARNAGSLARFVLVGVHTAYCGDYHPVWRVPMITMWQGLMPALTRLCGYFPGRLVGMGSDLPARFAYQWSRRTTPDIREGERADACLARCRSLRGKALLLTFTDDGFSTARGARRLLELLPNLEAELRVIAPRDVGLGGIGHFGFFRARAEKSLWPIAREWIGK